MSGAAAPAELAVRRLRVVDRGDDALRARLAAERLLSVAQPRPRGLAPGAVLLVRSLALRAPSGFDADGAAALARWRAAAEALLEARLRAAARPARGPVSDDATAVLFADRAELLACLAEDLAAGAAGARWWWRSALGPGVDATAVARRWEAEAADVPAALELLAARSRVVDAVRALAPSAAAEIAVAVARAFAVALPPLARTVPPAPTPRVRVQRASRGTTAAGSIPAAAADAAPWTVDVPEASAAALAPEHQALVGLCLALRRNRPLARSSAFAPAFTRWWAQASAPLGAAEPSAPSRAAAPHASPPGHGAVPPPSPAPTPDPPPGPSFAHPIPAAARRSAQPPGPRTATATPPPSPPDARRFLPAQQVENVMHSGESAPEPPRPLGDAPSAPAIPTALGGLFLLLNLGLHLDLYGDFTRPRAPGIALDPWDFAALLGRELLPQARRPRGRLARDPAWRLLAELAGRERAAPPGAGFHPSRAWRVPPAWLAPFEPARGAWRWSAADGRLRVLHPAGFLALDVPARGQPEGTLVIRASMACTDDQSSRSLVRDDDAVRRAAHPAAGVARPALARWVGWLAPYAAARLRLALATRTPAAAARTTLLLPARVAVGPGRVDVTVPLAALPLAIRRAGLDRTPGWIPAAGRHVAFHFSA